LERAAVHKAAGDIVEPEALTEVVEWLRWFHRVDSRLAADMGGVNRGRGKSTSSKSGDAVPDRFPEGSRQCEDSRLLELHTILGGAFRTKMPLLYCCGLRNITARL
jgi:hypothetical protein